MESGGEHRDLVRRSIDVLKISVGIGSHCWISQQKLSQNPESTENRATIFRISHSQALPGNG